MHQAASADTEMNAGTSAVKQHQEAWMAKRTVESIPCIMRMALPRFCLANPTARASRRRQRSLSPIYPPYMPLLGKEVAEARDDGKLTARYGRK